MPAELASQARVSFTEVNLLIISRGFEFVKHFFQIIFEILFHSNLNNLRSAFLNFWLNHAVLRASRVAVSLTAHI